MWKDVIRDASKNLSRFGLSGIGFEGPDGAQPRIFAPIPEAARCLLSDKFNFQGLDWNSIQIDAAEFVVLEPSQFDLIGSVIGALRRSFEISERVSIFEAGTSLGGIDSRGGTLGCLLVDNAGSNYFLTAYHAVPPRNIYKWVTRVYEAKASDAVTMLGGGLDCAVGKLQDYNDDTYKPVYLPRVVCDQPKERHLRSGLSPAPRVGEDVSQCGSKKRPGVGKIYDPGLVAADVIYGSQVRSFSGIVVIDGSEFAEDGDSGSIVYRVVGDDLDAVGLLFSRSNMPRYFLAFPMQMVLAAVPNLKLPP